MQAKEGHGGSRERTTVRKRYRLARMGRIGPCTVGLGRIKPSRFTEVIEREVSSLFLKRMGIDPKHEGRIDVAKRVGYLADISADSRPTQTALKPK